MNHMEYDAVTLGNHGLTMVEVLEEVARLAKFLLFLLITTSQKPVSID